MPLWKWEEQRGIRKEPATKKRGLVDRNDVNGAQLPSVAGSKKRPRFTRCLGGGGAGFQVGEIVEVLQGVGDTVQRTHKAPVREGTGRPGERETSGL